MNRPSSESHQTCLNGRVVREEEQSSTDHLREFDRIRTCVDKCHKLAPKPLGHKLHIVAPEGVEPSPTEPKPVVLPLYHRALSVEPRGVEPRSEDFQSSAYTKSAKFPNIVALDGFEPPPPEPESGMLPLHHGAVYRRPRRSRTFANRAKTCCATVIL